jgi:23S rRNA pseudouridine2605 synthase
VTLERLHKVLANAGVASRRDCEALISDGRVKVNGRVVREPGTRIDPTRARVQVDNELVQLSPAYVYILLHKPVGVVSTADDPQNRRTVVDLVQSSARLFPVGRLDANSEGLLLLTNDGDLTHHLTHPRFEVEKEYHALLDQEPDAAALQQWREGVMLDERRTAPAQVDVMHTTDEGVWVRIVLREGRKRQIREVARTLGYQVRRLIRVREGGLSLGDLPVGQWRTLTDEEVEALRAHMGPQQAYAAPGQQRQRSNKPSPNRAWQEREQARARERQERFQRRVPRTGHSQGPQGQGQGQGGPYRPRNQSSRQNSQTNRPPRSPNDRNRD